MRVKAEIWVKAYIRQCSVQGVYAVVVRRGDNDAGAIYIKVNLMDGNALLLTPAPAGFDGGDLDRKWIHYHEEGGKPEDDIDTYIEKQSNSDPDIWVVEVEDKEGRSFIEEKIMEF